MDLQVCITNFLTACQASGLAKKTICWYQKNLSRFAAFAEGFTTKGQQWWLAPVVQAFLADLQSRPRYQGHPTRQPEERSISIVTLHAYHRTLKRFFSWLVAEGLLTDNPMTRIKTPKIPKQVPKGITIQDFKALLAVANNPRDKALLLILADTAARASEVCRLEVKDVDLNQGIALVRGKGGKERPIFLSPPTIEALTHWLAVHPGSPWLFPGELGHLQPAGLAEVLKRLKKKAGVTGRCNPHAFRHGFAREYLLNGGNLASLCDLLGHTDINVTKMYSVFQLRELQAQHRRYSPVAQLFGAKGGED